MSLEYAAKLDEFVKELIKRMDAQTTVTRLGSIIRLKYVDKKEQKYSTTIQLKPQDFEDNTPKNLARSWAKRLNPPYK